MQLTQLEIGVDSLSGVGPKTADLYRGLSIKTVLDLIQTPPRAYEDRTERVCIGEQTDSLVQTNTIVEILSKSFFGPRMSSIKITVKDTENGKRGVLLGFNRSFLDKSVYVGGFYYLYANQTFGNSRNIYPEFSTFELKSAKNPEIFVPGGLIPVYSLTGSLTQKIIRRDIKNALSTIRNLEEVLPEKLIKRYSLLHYLEAIKKMHNPATMEEASLARRTLAFIEMFYLQLSSLRQANISLNNRENAEKKVKIYNVESSFIESLPFSLTEDQKKVLSEIRADMAGSERMNRLLQGDVGCGKTLVAWVSALHAIAEGKQVAFMAPTELLARQHAQSAAKLLEKTGVNVAYLDGSVHGKARTLLLAELKKGNIDLLIGTHALFSKDVVYKNVGYVIIDEQHRFGVEQRNSLFNKGENPDVLLMTATPIPRTLALTMYGNLNVSVIKTMPLGRMPVKTYVIPTSRREELYNSIEVELKRGHQAYFVYPKIESEESEGMENSPDYEYSLFSETFTEGAVNSDLQRDAGGSGKTLTKRDGIYSGNSQEDSANKTNESLKSSVGISAPGVLKSKKIAGLSPCDVSERYLQEEPKKTIQDVESMFVYLSKRYARFKGAFVHSRLSDEEKIQILSDFAEGKINFLVATSVVEVGIDVKNATCMIVENAERFGLSALHQLRGRVGRSTLQSWCFLVYEPPLTEEGKKRLSVLRRTTDGFEIAEEDLKIRGPGEISGLKQSGFLNLKYARLDTDIELMAEIRDTVNDILKEDAGLIKAENAPVRENFALFVKEQGI